VVPHAWNPARVTSAAELVGGAAGVVLGDVASTHETRSVADQVNAIGVGIDAVIHKGAIYVDPQRVATEW